MTTLDPDSTDARSGLVMGNLGGLLMEGVLALLPRRWYWRVSVGVAIVGVVAMLTLEVFG